METEASDLATVEAYIWSKYTDLVDVKLEEVPGQEGDHFHIRVWRCELRFYGDQKIALDVWATNTIELATYPITQKPRTLHAGRMLRKYGLDGLKEKVT